MSECGQQQVRGCAAVRRGCAWTGPVASPPRGGRRRARAGPCRRCDGRGRGAGSRPRPSQSARRCRGAEERTAGRAGPGRGPQASPHSSSPRSRARIRSRPATASALSWAVSWAETRAGPRPSCSPPPPASPALTRRVPVRPNRTSRGGPHPPSSPPPPPAQGSRTMLARRGPDTRGTSTHITLQCSDEGAVVHRLLGSSERRPRASRGPETSGR